VASFIPVNYDNDVTNYRIVDGQLVYNGPGMSVRRAILRDVMAEDSSRPKISMQGKMTFAAHSWVLDDYCKPDGEETVIEHWALLKASGQIASSDAEGIERICELHGRPLVPGESSTTRLSDNGADQTALYFRPSLSRLCSTNELKLCRNSSACVMFNLLAANSTAFFWRLVRAINSFVSNLFLFIPPLHMVFGAFTSKATQV